MRSRIIHFELGPRPPLAQVCRLLLLAAGSWLLAASSCPAVTIENLEVGFNGYSKVGSWTPVYVTLHGGARGFDGTLDVAAPDDDGAPTHFVRPQPVHLQANETSPPLLSYARPGRPDADYAVRLVNAEGREEAQREFRLGNVDRSVLPNRRLFAAVGHQAGIEPAMKFGGPEQNFLGQLSPERLPNWWAGYEGLDALVLATSDPAYLSQIQPSQEEAVRRWVELGGRLVVTVGSSWQAVATSFLGKKGILPVQLGQSHSERQLGGLVNFVGAKSPLSAGEGVPVADLNVGPDARVVLRDEFNVPLIVRGRYGLGTVTVIAVDLERPPFARWKAGPELWAKILEIEHSDNWSANGPPALRTSGGAELSSQLRYHLDQFPGVQVVSFGWVAFWIFLYILLIGPGDYFLVKKVLRRMELTWITFPVSVVVISLLAYQAASWIKGKELRVNQIDLVDVDATQKIQRGTTWFSLFSPRIENYRIALRPSAVLAAPEVVLSWFGLPEDRLGGMGGNGGLNLSQADYRYGRMAESLDGVRIQVWSTKSFLGRWGGAPPPTFDASFTRQGSDELDGMLTNRSGETLDDVAVAYGSHIYLVGTLKAGRSVRIGRATHNRELRGYLQEQTEDSMAPDQGEAAQANGLTHTLRMLMFARKVGSVPEPHYPASAPPLEADDQRVLDLSAQLDFGRPIVIARRSRASAGLLINGAPFAAVNQRSFLRVVLPAPKPEK